ncbi:TonB-dependent receptor [Brevundimonas intermedia]|uniref:TonB-dependent receptor n=1 Tax=Brevundimonas intermedia TaxID=74315 RepID=UPI0022F25A21|nr:TonB-dependent receptor [Brevundimonas intermedia]
MKPPAPSTPFGARRDVVAMVAALSFLTVGGWTSSAEAQEGMRDFDIPAQDARRALVQLCVSAGCELAFVAPADELRLSRPVRGRMSWRAAVRQMLEGTGLRHRFIGARGVRIWTEAPAPPEPAPLPAAELESITVVGRWSEQIEESLRRKQAADVISDSASSTRIGELPAANLAEALQRVPGVAIEREVGEGQFVSVRGLGPLFQSVTLNGAPVAFNENIRNSTQSGRQFRFRALSADLLAGAQLTKSATPDLIEGGIGSNIDIETIGGLDGDPFVSVRGGVAVEARTRRPETDISVAGRLVSGDGDWGLVGGMSQEGRSVLYDRFQVGRYTAVRIDGEDVMAPNDVRTTVEHEDRLRRSVFLGGEWRASPSVRLRFDGLVSTFDNTIREDRIAYGLGGLLEAADATAFIQDGVVTAASVQAGTIDNNTEFSEQAHLNVVASGVATVTVGEWTLKPRISLSRARSRLDTPLERISFRATTPPAYGFDVRDAASDRQAALLETDLDLTDASAFAFKRLGVRAIESVDDDLTALVDVRRPVDVPLGVMDLVDVRFGGQISDRSRDYQRRDREASLRTGAEVTSAFLVARVHDGVFNELIRRHSGRWAAADFDLFQDAFLILGESDTLSVDPDALVPTGADLQNSYAVGERVGAVYGRADFEGQAAGTPFFGNLGLRLVTTRTEVNGAFLNAGQNGGAAIRPVSHAGSDTALLPSLNIALDVDEGRRLRLAASRTMTRPSLADLRLATVPASSLVSNIYERGQAEIDAPSPGSIFTGVGGNPDLSPYMSTNLDASFEWSFPQGALSVAIFHKAIDDFIGLVEAPEVLVFETRAGPLVRAEVLMSRPANLGRATSRGLEIGLHRRLSSGFGLWASGTFTDGDGPGGRSLAGVSRLAYSINPFFERGPLAVGLSWSWRSAFRSEADMQGGGVSDFTVGAAGYLDVQASFEIGSGGVLVIAASNLTDTTDLAYEHDTRRLLQLGRVGPSVTASLRWAL